MALTPPPPARTMLHRRLQAETQAVETVGVKLDGVGSQLGGLATQVTGIQTSIGPELAKVTESLGLVSYKLDLIHSAILATGGQQHSATPALEAFEFIRVLNQVEDLVTDHDFDLKRNNLQLVARRNEEPTQKCHEVLRRLDTILAERFAAVYRPFQVGDVPERAARYVEIDQLRADIVRQFAAPPPGPALDVGSRRTRRK